MPHESGKVVATAGDVEVEQPELEVIANDPILSPTISTSLSRSRIRIPAITFPVSGEDTFEDFTGGSENDPLLGVVGGKRERRKPFYRPRPLWIVPFAVLASISRAMTIAPRLEVFTQLSCNAVYGHSPHYNHSTGPHELLSSSHTLRLHGSTSIQTLSHPAIRIESEQDGAEDDSDGDTDDDPLRIPSKRCRSDPKVQSGAARLATIMATTVGVFSVLTTGWWGHFGDRHGRTRVLAAATFGLLLTDIVFVLVSLPHTPLATHGHKLLIIAPAIEGLLGGWSTLQGATSAYISDCTSDGSRAHIFSRFMGMLYFGFAIGPTLAAWVITHPPSFLRPLLQLETASVGRTVTPVFLVTVCFSLANFLQSIFLIPESLGKKKGGSAPTPQSARSEENSAVPAVIESESVGVIDQTATSKAASGGIPFIKGVFTPLLVFAPKVRSNGRDWNMTLLALALFGYLLSSGIFQLKYFYAEHVFGWETEQVGYYMTVVGGARAIHLLFLMPYIISRCKPKLKKNTAEQMQNNAVTVASGGNKVKPKPTKAQLVAEMKFDLRITRLSYAVDALSHTLASLSSPAPTTAAQAAFVGFTVLSSFGSGVVPSMQSLALCIMQTDAAEDERLGVVAPSGTGSGSATIATGSIFGALAVLQATGQMILGPLLFGLVYSTTVARFPKAIFVVAASILLMSLLLLSRVRPHSHSHSRTQQPRYLTRDPAEIAARKQMLLRGAGTTTTGKKKNGRAGWRYGSGPEFMPERGRSRVSKDLSGGSGVFGRKRPTSSSNDVGGRLEAGQVYGSA